LGSADASAIAFRPDENALDNILLFLPCGLQKEDELDVFVSSCWAGEDSNASFRLFELRSCTGSEPSSFLQVEGVESTVGVC
jgi:hypothetical protein